MNNLQQKQINKAQRKNRVRAKLSGTAERPRLTVTISNTHISAQIIDDVAATTLIGISTVGKKLPANSTMTQKAEWIGSEIAKKAKAKKISKVAFDRNGKMYHGRIKALADAARKEGLEF